MSAERVIEQLVCRIKCLIIFHVCICKQWTSRCTHTDPEVLRGNADEMEMQEMPSYCLIQYIL